jgi:DNA-binding NtrC family response regulator
MLMLSTVVLLVDDEVPFVEAMARRLTKRGLDVKSAFSGEEALQTLKKLKHVDVIILDVKMPLMDGLETLREIKKAYPIMEVIMLTGHATVETAIEGMKLGAYDYLMKPCDMDVLMKKLEDAKKRKKEHEQKIMEAQAMNIVMRRGG